MRAGRVARAVVGNRKATAGAQTCPDGPPEMGGDVIRSGSYVGYTGRVTALLVLLSAHRGANTCATIALLKLSLAPMPSGERRGGPD